MSLREDVKKVAQTPKNLLAAAAAGFVRRLLRLRCCALSAVARASVEHPTLSKLTKTQNARSSTPIAGRRIFIRKQSPADHGKESSAGLPDLRVIDTSSSSQKLGPSRSQGADSGQEIEACWEPENDNTPGWKPSGHVKAESELWKRPPLTIQVSEDSFSGFPRTGVAFLLLNGTAMAASGIQRSSIGQTPNFATSRAGHSIARDVLTIGERIGSGGYGSVYIGKWYGTQVAVKVVVHRKEQTADLQEIWEVIVSTKMRHPNIVQTFDWIVLDSLTPAGTQDPPKVPEGNENNAARKYSCDIVVYVMVMELCDKSSLEEFLQYKCFSTDVPSSMKGLIDTLLDLANGLAYLHRHRTIHADLKSSNVLLSSRSNDRGFIAKIGDFGLSRVLPLGAETVTTAFCGTATHSSPEYIREGVLSLAADVFSFGVVMWEMLTGKVPYHDTPNLIFSVWNKEPLEFPRGCPPSYVNLAQMCMAERPRERFTPSVHQSFIAIYEITVVHGDVKDAQTLSPRMCSRPPITEVMIHLEGMRPWSKVDHGKMRPLREFLSARDGDEL